MAILMDRPPTHLATTPADDWDRERLQCRAFVEDRLFVLLRLWFVMQLVSAVVLVPGLALFLGRGNRVSHFLFVTGVYLLTFVPTAWAAWLTLSNWTVLRRRWRFYGLAPWAVLATEGALILSGLS